MNGDSNALQRQVAQAAVILQRDAQVMQMQQVALDVKMNPQDVTSKRLLLFNKTKKYLSNKNNFLYKIEYKHQKLFYLKL